MENEQNRNSRELGTLEEIYEGICQRIYGDRWPEVKDSLVRTRKTWEKVEPGIKRYRVYPDSKRPIKIIRDE